MDFVVIFVSNHGGFSVVELSGLPAFLVNDGGLNSGRDVSCLN